MMICVNWTIGNKFQWNSNENWNLFIKRNVFGNGVCVKAAILSWFQWVNSLRPKEAWPALSDNIEMFFLCSWISAFYDVFWFEFHWSLCLRVKLTVSHSLIWILVPKHYSNSAPQFIDTCGTRTQYHTETERSSGWLPWSSLEMLKLALALASPRYSVKC